MKTAGRLDLRGVMRFVFVWLVVLLSFSTSTRAEDWMFRRSYFSHRLPDGAPPGHPIPESRSAYRTAYYRQGFGVSSAYRVNNYVIQNGNRVDRTYYREGWVEFYPQGD